MEIKIPKTKEQYKFESDCEHLINLLLLFTPEERKQVMDYVQYISSQMDVETFLKK